jgi:hypothetical protein
MQYLTNCQTQRFQINTTRSKQSKNTREERKEQLSKQKRTEQLKLSRALQLQPYQQSSPPPPRLSCRASAGLNIYFKDGEEDSQDILASNYIL